MQTDKLRIASDDYSSPDPFETARRAPADHRTQSGGLAARCGTMFFEYLETFRHKQEVLKSHCRAVDRDYDEIKQVICRVVFIAENGAMVESGVRMS